MKLNQMEKTINPVIFERGEAYRENGHILSIDEIKPGAYLAEVEGSELYDVEIQLGSRGEVAHQSCECLYDQGPICKHAVAVLLEIRDELSSKKEKGPSASKKSSAPKITIADHLAKLNKDELITLLLDISIEFKEVGQAISLKFIEGDNKEDLNQYKKVIRASIKKNSDRHGFVAYRQVPLAVAGAEKVMEKAEEALKRGNHLRAANICFCVMHEMADLLQTSDDSDGYVGDLIQTCLSFIHHVAEQFADDSLKDRSILYRLLLEEALHPSLEGWNEWRLSLMESASDLITNAAEKEMWNHLLERMESHESSHSSYSSYFSEQAAMLRYQVIQKLEGDSQAWMFLQDHLDMRAFRKMAIEDAIKNLRFDQALELAEQGEHKDTINGSPGLVAQWKKFRYDIYELTHQAGPQKELAEEFALEGDYNYYLRLKELYSKEQWKAAYGAFIEKIEKNYNRSWSTASLYTRILVEEKETQRLLNYVLKYRAALVDYYPYLVGEFAEEVYLLFTQVISEEASRSSNRKEYQKVCGTIRHLIKAGGEVQAKAMIEQLRLTYPNRSAFLDELQKIY